MAQAIGPGNSAPAGRLNTATVAGAVISLLFFGFFALVVLKGYAGN